MTSFKLTPSEQRIWENTVAAMVVHHPWVWQGDKENREFAYKYATRIADELIASMRKRT